MISKKIIITIVAFLIIVIIFFILTLTSFQDNLPPDEIPTNITPAPSLIKKTPLEITSTLPEENPEIIRPPIQQVAFEFNNETKPEDVLYTIDPFVPVSLIKGESEKTIIFSVDDIWENGITTITIQKNTKDKNGNLLNKDYSYKFTSGFEEIPFLETDY